MTYGVTDQEIVNHPDYAHWEAEYGPDCARAMVEDKAWRAARQAERLQLERDRATLFAAVHLPEIPFLQ